MSAEPQSSGKIARILLVEDSPADAELLREALEEYAVRCELILITDGERAIDFLLALDTGETPCPDLVILDLSLPRKPGQEVLRKVRASLKCNHVPVVILTSSGSQKDKDDAATLGASKYIRKPLHLAEFLKLGDVFRKMLDGDLTET